MRYRFEAASVTTLNGLGMARAEEPEDSEAGAGGLLKSVNCE